jgi:rhodanese-related sulfurtransferase/DNA-binding transcriptional ArsR family regulator
MDLERRRQFRDHVYEIFAEVGKALANGRRLVLLDLLCQAERSVDDIASETGLSVASVSQHLQILRAARLVASRREGVRVFYKVANPAAAELWRALRVFGEEELPAVDRVLHSYLADRDKYEAIAPDELRKLLADDAVVLIDVRPAIEFQSGHIPGALSMPVSELEARVHELPDDKEIVAYCRGRYCVYADDAVRELQERGFRARRLELSVQDWESLH